jgi:hypothetical protein
MPAGQYAQVCEKWLRGRKDTEYILYKLVNEILLLNDRGLCDKNRAVLVSELTARLGFF